MPSRTGRARVDRLRPSGRPRSGAAPGRRTGAAAGELERPGLGTIGPQGCGGAPGRPAGSVAERHREGLRGEAPQGGPDPRRRLARRDEDPLRRHAMTAGRSAGWSSDAARPLWRRRPGRSADPRARAETLSAATLPGLRGRRQLRRRVRRRAEGVHRREVGPCVQQAEIVDVGVLLGELQIRDDRVARQLERRQPAALLLRDPLQAVRRVLEPRDVASAPPARRPRRPATVAQRRDPDAPRELRRDQDEDDHPDVLVAARRRRPEKRGVEAGQGPEAEQDRERHQQLAGVAEPLQTASSDHRRASTSSGRPQSSDDGAEGLGGGR